MDFMMLTEGIHLQLTKIGSATTVLEAIVSRAGEHIVVWAELEDVLESLHCGLIDEWPAVTR